MCTTHCQVQLVDAFRIKKANLKPQWHHGSEAGCWGEPFSRELKSRASFPLYFRCLNMAWFEPLEAAREGLCSFTPAPADMKEVACATLRGHSGTPRAGHSANRRSSLAAPAKPDLTKFIPPDLFVLPALPLTLIQPLQERRKPQKQTKPASAALQRHLLVGWQLHQQVKMSFCCCSEALV